MKKITITLLLIASTSVVIAEVATKKTPADILIGRVMGAYEKSVQDADDYYGKFAAPIQKRRDGKIVAAGDMAIKKLNSARRSVSEIDGIKLEQQISIVRKSLDEKVGDVPKVTRKAPVLAVCGVKFKEHTYLAFISKANWKEANAMCKKMGGHLAYIETREEASFLSKTFQGYLLVGATDAHKEGDWRWGNKKPVDRSLWGARQPDNAKGKQHYAALMNGALDDGGLSEIVRDGFICEWE
jgi:hypothetical protein